jgi:hypothetical protein
MNTINSTHVLQKTAFSQHVIIRGDNSGNQVTYAWNDGTNVHTSTSPSQLLEAMKLKGCKPVINHNAISFLLHNSLIPTPMTVFKDVYALGVGDTLTFDPKTLSDGPVFQCDYPYFQGLSSGESIPSTQTLLYLLRASLERKLSGTAVLMLSSGKDSVSIALAIREAGLANDIPAYTYADPESGYNDEALDSKKIAHNLGLKHTTIYVPKETNKVKGALLHFFENLISFLIYLE